MPGLYITAGVLAGVGRGTGRGGVDGVGLLRSGVEWGNIFTIYRDGYAISERQGMTCVCVGGGGGVYT